MSEDHAREANSASHGSTEPEPTTEYMCLVGCCQRFLVDRQSPVPTECPNCHGQHVAKTLLLTGPTASGFAFGMALSSLILGPITGLPAVTLGLGGLLNEQDRLHRKRMIASVLIGLCTTIVSFVLLFWALFFYHDGYHRNACLLALTRLNHLQAATGAPADAICPQSRERYVYQVPASNAPPTAFVLSDSEFCHTGVQTNGFFRRLPEWLLPGEAGCCVLRASGSTEFLPEQRFKNELKLDENAGFAQRMCMDTIFRLAHRRDVMHGMALDFRWEQPSDANAGKQPGGNTEKQAKGSGIVIAYQTTWPADLSSLSMQAGVPSKCPITEKGYIYLPPATNAPGAAIVLADGEEMRSQRCVLRADGTVECLPEARFQEELASATNSNFALYFKSVAPKKDAGRKPAPAATATPGR